MDQKENQSFIPRLPENAPFTPEQRAYLNGFLAGIFSRMPAPRQRSAQPVNPWTLCEPTR
jgi:hypothetical protein